MTRENFAGYLRQGLAYLKPKAAAGKDVEIIADFVWENQEDAEWTAILGAIEQGATFEHLLQFDPEIGQNPTLRAWFEKFYRELHNEIFSSDNPRGAAGDAANAAGNAGAGAAGSQPPGGGGAGQ